MSNLHKEKEMDNEVDEQNETAIYDLPDYIFSRVKGGLHDGLLIEELGYRSAPMRESLGIEGFIGVASHGTQRAFFEHIKKVTGSELSDWEACTLTLKEQYAPDNDVHVCRTSLAVRGPRTMTFRPVKVYAVRHKSWVLLNSWKVSEFYVALQRSAFNAAWERDHPGEEAKPSNLRGTAGFVVKVRTAESAGAVSITWPCLELSQTIPQADEALKRGDLHEVCISEGGFMVAYRESDKAKWLKMAALDKKWGGGKDLYELAYRVGLF
jgi:hypothetical protein